MNSRSGVNQSSLVNFSTDLPSLDTKDNLLSFPFDHLYACHSDGSKQRDGLQLNKHVDLSSQCIDDGTSAGVKAIAELEQLKNRLTVTDNENKRLKDLLIYHLDLIQQQNELINKRDKLYQAVQRENETLKGKLNRRHGLNLPPPPPLPVLPLLILPPPSPQTTQPLPSTSSTPPPPTPPPLPPPPSPTAPQLPCPVVKQDGAMLNSFTELLLPENRSNSYLFDTDLSKPQNFEKETFGLARTTTPIDPGVKPFATSDTGASSLLEPKKKYSNMRCDGFKAVDSKRSLIKKDALKSGTKRSEALYTVTSNSGNPVIQRVQRNKKKHSTGVGHLSRMTKTTPKVEPHEPSKVLNEPTFDHFGINKKSKLINTYGKRPAITSTATSTTTTMPKRSAFGSLSDRLQLIDTTPTGEDPYQLGEADLREQSPIPKLMLQKTNHGRMRSSVLDQPTRRIYDPDSPEPKTPKVESRFSSTFTNDLKKETKTEIVYEPDLDLVKTEPGIEWRTYSPRTATSIEQCASAVPPLDMFADSPGNPASLSMDCTEFQDMFTSDAALELGDLTAPASFTPSQRQPKKRTTRNPSFTTQLLNIDDPIDFIPIEPQLLTPTKETKRGRKRALSTTGLGKGGKGTKGTAKPRTKGKAAQRQKKSPPPARTTMSEYFTHISDTDLSWYFGLDAEIKLDDLEPPIEQQSSTVEVPRWREKPFTGMEISEGTENLDDKVFEKRHQKLEAEERRQLRWHMRRIREQRHVEKLKQRQRDSWCTTVTAPSVYTLWPRPQRDIRFIEITDTLPVMAFGEVLPDLPEADFVLPWVRTSKALKRSKRSKTLH